MRRGERVGRRCLMFTGRCLVLLAQLVSRQVASTSKIVIQSGLRIFSPHSMNRALVLILALTLRAIAAEPAAILPGTEPLTWTGDLSTKMHEAALHDVDKRIDESVTNRSKLWHRKILPLEDTAPVPDFNSKAVEAYDLSVEPNREHLRQILGLVDKRLPVEMERFGKTMPRKVRDEKDFGKDDAESRDDPTLVADTDRFKVYQVRWPVLDGIHGEGLLLVPKGYVAGHVVVVPDADQTPEQVSGLAPGIERPMQFARHLAAVGLGVLVPTLVDRGTAASGNAEIVMTNQPHREWIHRQGYMMGRPIIGLEVQKVLSAVDWFEKNGAGPHIGVAGYGEGGLIAFYAAAVDKRIRVALVSGYFKSRQQTWKEPLYRNVWGLLREFGDAEIASLITEPRILMVHHADEPKVDGPPLPTNNQKKCAAPGQLTTPAFAEVKTEFDRISALIPSPVLQRARLYPTERYLGDQENSGALVEFGEAVDCVPSKPGSHPCPRGVVNMMQGPDSVDDRSTPMVLKDVRSSFDPQARQLRQVKEMEAFLQKLARESDHARNESFLYKLLPQFKAEPWTYQADFETLPQGPFIDGVKPYKQQFWNEVIGRIEEPLPPPNPRTRKIYDEPKWTGYEVVLDVGGDGFSWGILCLPKDIKLGEKRPVVVCQHGRHGLPKLVIEGDTPAYHNFAARLAEQGFITFAPHNLYNKEEQYRTLARKGNTVKLSMFSYILRHHEQILNWLETLPMVDTKRIGFYGLSYGGESAVRLPPLLDRYCLSICSGDFNDWTRKVTSTDDRHSFMFTDEWEMPYFNMGNKFGYAELTYMMFPRPFMVERGSHDGVAPDEWVAYEFAKTRGLYSKFGLGDRAQIEFFNGGHTIHGQGTFDFLHKHLNWPAR
ncbi:MAG: putative dienelactone hydrolase [Verrucomicrobiaceae bacterium]|nr:putative dienelactone hydrolase [Verrucomicrobiaceae bacterium]